MTLALYRKGIELCEIVITETNPHTGEVSTKSFKGMPNQVETWAVYNGADREDIQELFENLFEDDATYAELTPEDDCGVFTADRSAKVEKVENNVIYIDFKKAA